MAPEGSERPLTYREVELFKTTKKKPDYPTIYVDVEPRNSLEGHAEAIVDKKTKNKFDQADYEYQLMYIGITRFFLGGMSAVGRTKVDIEISYSVCRQDVLLVLIHLEQLIMLHDELGMKILELLFNLTYS